MLTPPAVCFRMNDQEWGLPLDGVREVVPPLPAARVPGAPAFVLGLVNLRGMPLAVLDLHRLLQGPALNPGDRARIVVIDADGVQAGLLTQGVTRIARFESDRLGHAGSAIGGLPAEAVEGLVADPAHPVILLRPRALLALPAVRALRTVSGGQEVA